VSLFNSIASFLVLFLVFVPSLSVAHSGHGEPGMLHDLSHGVWLIGALIVMTALTAKIFLSKKQGSRVVSRSLRQPRN